MANTRSGKPTFDIVGDTLTVSGSFPTVTTGALTVTGRGFTAARTGTGTYTITFNSLGYDTLLDIDVKLRRPSVDDARAVPGTYVAATRVFTFWLVAEDGTPAAADPANDANSVVHFTAKLARNAALV